VVKPALITIEGLNKATRGGSEWEPIKILHQNLAYVTNQTQRISLLSRPRPHRYWIVIGSRNRVRVQESQRNDESVQANHKQRYDNKRQIKRSSYYLIHITSNTFRALPKKSQESPHKHQQQANQHKGVALTKRQKNPGRRANQHREPILSPDQNLEHRAETAGTAVGSRDAATLTRKRKRKPSRRAAEMAPKRNQTGALGATGIQRKQAALAVCSRSRV
jgi:hypothetical protein